MPRDRRRAGAGSRSGIASADPRSPVMPSQLAAERAYAAAGVGPDDIDVAELHDAAAPAELILMEAVGLVRPWAVDRSGALRGRPLSAASCPSIPAAVLIARGHPLGATGCAQLVELTEQLRGRSGERQVGVAPGSRSPRTAAVCSATARRSGWSPSSRGER